MARKPKVEKKEEKKKITAQEQIQAVLNSDTAKGLHFNDVDEIHYKISTGSLNLDLEVGGGFPCGIHRFQGPSESGKTSCALSIAKNFQEEFGKKAMVIFVKAEGRLDPLVLARSGLDTSDERFFVLDTNVFEVVYELIRKLVLQNEEDRKYFFIIDSIDALCRKADLDKPFEKSEQVAGGALVSSVFLKKMALPIIKMGHMLIFTSQVRAKVDPNGMSSGKPQSSGGNAWRHYANFVLDFQERYSNDIMYENPSASKIIDKGRPLGHDCKIIFRKSINEKTGVNMSYPIIYGRTNGNSVWVEREIIDLLLGWGYIEKAGSWLNVDPDLTKAIEGAGLQFIEKIQGIDNLCRTLEKSPDVKNFLFKFCKDEVAKMIQQMNEVEVPSDGVPNTNGEK